MLNQDLYQYTLMPTHMTKLFTVEELKSASLAGPFDFTKELPVLRVAHKSKAGTKTHSFHFPEKMEDTQSVIYDVKSDPGQTKPVTDKKILERLKKMSRYQKQLQGSKLRLSKNYRQLISH